MAATGYEKDINLPGPMPRDRGTLLGAMQPIPPDELIVGGTNRAWLGVTWLPWGVGNLSTDALDCNVVYDLSARDLPDIAIQPAFMMWDALKCSTLSSTPEWLRSRVVDNLNVYASAAFASELSTAAASGGLAISGDATYTPTIITATAVDLEQAIAQLEDHLGDTLHGAVGMIHLTPGLLTVAVGEGYAEFRDGQYRTPTGHIVVGDAGFDGDATPFGSTAASSTQAWIYATSMVFYAISGVDTTDILTDDPVDTDLLHNLNEPIAKRYGVLAWDPNATGAIKVTTVQSSGGGGGGSAGLTDVAAGTVTLSNVNDTASSTTLLAAEGDRLGVIVFNDSSADLYLKYGATASTTSFTVKILAGGYWEMPLPIYTGIIDAVWSSDSSGAARITESKI